MPPNAPHPHHRSLVQNKKENQLMLAADSTAVEARDGSLGIWLLPVHAAYANLIKNVWDYCANARCWTLALLRPSNRDIGCLWVRPPRMPCIRDGLLSVGLALMRREYTYCCAALLHRSSWDDGYLWVRPPGMSCIRDGLLSIRDGACAQGVQFCLLELFQTKRNKRERAINSPRESGQRKTPTARVGSEGSPRGAGAAREAAAVGAASQGRRRRGRPNRSRPREGRAGPVGPRAGAPLIDFCPSGRLVG